MNSISALHACAAAHGAKPYRRSFNGAAHKRHGVVFTLSRWHICACALAYRARRAHNAAIMCCHLRIYRACA